MAASIPSSSLSSSASTVVKNKINYTRLCRLVVDIGSGVLRGVLDAYLHPPGDLQKHLNSPGVHNILKTLRSKRVLNTQQWDKLYPPAPAIPSSSTFDITLLFLLLRNTCGLTPPTTGWNAAPLPADLSKEADLIRVKLCRNEITAHSAVMELSDADFETHWAEIKASLIRLGGLQYEPEIQRLKIESIDPESEDYFNVLLRSWEEGEDKKLDAIREEIKQTKDYQPKPFCTLPQKPSHDVVHRHEEVSMTLDEIRRLRTAFPNHVTVTYLSGNPGCGKSELARQIGEKYFDEFEKDESSKFVATLNASSLENLIQSYMELAFQLECNDVSLIMSSETNSNEQKLAQLQALVVPKVQKYSSWLIIVDNVEDIKMVSKFIPHSGQKLLHHGKGHVLITTQDIESIPTSDSHAHQIQLKNGMKLHDAAQTLYAISGLSCDEKIAKTLCEKLGFQPLALACAAVYIRQTRCADPTMNWESYLEKVEKGNLMSADELYEKTNHPYPRSMKTAIKMAVEKILEKSEVLRHTFEFMAAVAPEFISLEHVMNYVRQCIPEMEKENLAITITSSALIITSKDSSKRQSVRVHQVVYDVLQSVYQSAFLQTVDEFSFFMKFMKVFSYIKNIRRDIIKFIQETAPLIQHFVFFSEKVKDYFERHQILKILSETNVYGVHYQCSKLFTHQYIPFTMFLIETVSYVCEKHWKYSTARTLCEISHCLTENCHRSEDSTYGSNHPEVAVTLHYLGLVLNKLEKLDEAKECLETVLAIKESTYGSNDPKVATTLNNLGLVLDKLEKLDEAKECLEKALAIHESTYGSNHPDVATTLNSLGSVLRKLEKLDETKDCYEKALAIKESTYGSNHPKVATTLNNLGLVLDKLKKLDEAKDCYEKALAIKESTYGSNHPEVATTLNNLGLVLDKLEKLDEAKECFEKALAINERTYCSNHPKVARSSRRLGRVLKQLGKVDGGKNLHEKAMAGEKST